MTTARQCLGSVPNESSSRASSRNSLPSMWRSRMIVDEDVLQNLARELGHHPAVKLAARSVVGIKRPGAVRIDRQPGLVPQVVSVVEHDLDPDQFGQALFGLFDHAVHRG